MSTDETLADALEAELSDYVGDDAGVARQAARQCVQSAGLVGWAPSARSRADELRALAEDREDGPGAYIGHPDHWGAMQARDRMWRDALERRAVRIETGAGIDDEPATPHPPRPLVYHRKAGRRHLAAACMGEGGCAIESEADQ